MSEQVMVFGKVNKGISKNSSVQGYESAWLGRWIQLGNEVKFHGPSHGDFKELIRCEDNNVKEHLGRKHGENGVEFLSFPMLKVSQKRDSITNLQAYPVFDTTQSFHDDAGSSSKAMVDRMCCYPPGDNRLSFPIQEKTTQNLLQLIKPVRIYATVDPVERVSREINLPEEDGGQLLKESTVSMKVFGGYLDLFPNPDHQHKGVMLQSLESSKDMEEDELRNIESSTETDRLQMIHLSGSISEIPDMNEEPPLLPGRETSGDGHRGETSNSATQSINVDHFLSRESKRVRLEPEASSRWVKRLKTNVSDSSRHDETKSMMKIEEASSDQKGNNNLFLEILKSGINNLQPRNQEPVNHGEAITLLHPWIQRWCKKKDKPTDPEMVPESKKELENKHYPSIAAMALMGKGLSGLKHYGLRKSESFMVWNARDIK